MGLVGPLIFAGDGTGSCDIKWMGTWIVRREDPGSNQSLEGREVGSSADGARYGPRRREVLCFFGDGGEGER